MTGVAQKTASRHALGLSTLWFGLFTAPAAWAIQELASYSMVSHACFPSLTPGHAAAGAAARQPALVLSVLMVAVAGASLFVACRSWQRTGPGREGAEVGAEQAEPGVGRMRFMALSGVLVAAVFLLNLLMNALVFFLVPACG